MVLKCLLLTRGSSDRTFKVSANQPKLISEKNYNGVNDPTAGSPTVTLLRLLLPLSDKVYLTSNIVATT
jgi:hypothetical protein